MTISVLDLFSVGIGPSSSHTVGPMRAAARFVADLGLRGTVPRTASFAVTLYGSLAATGAGHGTQPAILLGLDGHQPETLEVEIKDLALARIRESGAIVLAGREVPIREQEFELLPRTVLDAHPNGMRLRALDGDGAVLHERTYFSIGGGFVLTAEEIETGRARVDAGGTETGASSSAFGSAAELLELASARGTSIADVMLAFETERLPEGEVRTRLLALRDVMEACAAHGIKQSGYLPGALGVKRRAPEWFERLSKEDPHRSPEFAEDWVNLIALAVNEENASGGRIVTAPTNGAAGIIPAVLHYAVHYTRAGREDPDGAAVRFLLAAGAIGSLFKERASISGAEVGCQGEVGSAASMAAGGLAEILGGTPPQVENAAEIAMEHSLGLTCDPIGGLVQIPCIERNAISAGKAINAARMALRGDGSHRVSLDQVIETMRLTGLDLSSKYKETSTGGLAVNVPVTAVEC
ncbi:L-serine ammonia-lyase [Tsukamurella asaccharolytica]|uniref:L-serine dehydratase n=1 Tax=Tsukamurella asaccharolytica TaxID=2592067 RepID=A0A5C5R5E6_9ACTN|nr:L-serine ammonia-lyase [Tsukamurella asaccharolytica]TWS17942.1 L-serine ammonia-lyase [Tsukamurella asaccharolytica]